MSRFAGGGKSRRILHPVNRNTTHVHEHVWQLGNEISSWFQPFRGGKFRVKSWLLPVTDLTDDPRSRRKFERARSPILYHFNGTNKYFSACTCCISITIHLSSLRTQIYTDSRRGFKRFHRSPPSRSRKGRNRDLEGYNCLTKWFGSRTYFFFSLPLSLLLLLHRQSID